MSGFFLYFKLKEELNFNRHTDLVYINITLKAMFIHFLAWNEITPRSLFCKNCNIMLRIFTFHCYSYTSLFIYSNCNYKKHLDYKYFLTFVTILIIFWNPGNYYTDYFFCHWAEHHSCQGISWCLRVFYETKRGGTDGWGTAIQVGSSRFNSCSCNWRKPSSRTLVDSSSNRNEYQDYVLGPVHTLPLSCADWLEIGQPQAPGTLWARPALYWYSFCLISLQELLELKQMSLRFTMWSLQTVTVCTQIKEFGIWPGGRHRGCGSRIFKLGLTFFI
jgi:hypothetical protein